jgi:hypothetical protein
MMFVSGSKKRADAPPPDPLNPPVEPCAKNGETPSDQKPTEKDAAWPPTAPEE